MIMQFMLVNIGGSSPNSLGSVTSHHNLFCPILHFEHGGPEIFEITYHSATPCNSHCFALLLLQFIPFWVLKFVVVECFVFCWNRVESIEGCIIEIAQFLDRDHELIEIVKKGDG